MMIIKNVTVLAPEEVKQSLIKISKKNYYYRFIFVGILGILGLLIVLISGPIGSAASGFSTGYIFLTFAIMFAIYNFISIMQIPKQVQKKNKDVLYEGMINEFTLKEESFLLNVKIGKQNVKYQADYKNLHKIVDLEDRILFMISKTDVFIAKKDAFASEKEVEIFFYGLAKHKIKYKTKKQKIEK